MSDWPYPRWIAHRGAGLQAPENTLAAFRCGAHHGFGMFECDAKLSADGEIFLLHDDTLDRTTNSQGPAGHADWASLCRLDAGAWHSPDFAGEPLPRLQALARFCQAGGHRLNIEIKPCPGTQAQTGRRVAEEADRLWAGESVPPLLTSFDTQALAAAREAAPALPRGLLLQDRRPSWLEEAKALGCVAVVCQYRLWDADAVARAHAAGMRCLSYTVNDEAAARHLLALGTEGLITDRMDLPAALG